MLIFAPVWGRTHVDWFKNGCLKSLSWPKNAQAIKGAKWVIGSDDKYFNEVVDLVGGMGEVSSFIKNTGETDGMPFMQKALVLAVENALRLKEQLLVALPDFVYSEGTVERLVENAKAPGSCVTFAHARVNPGILGEDFDVPKEGCDLVDLLFKYPHNSFIQGELGPDITNSYSGGISWRRLSKEYNLLGVQHRLPSPFLINPLEGDLVYFKGERFDAWDHRWPSTWYGRQRYLGSSDAGFMLELTQKENNNPALNPINKNEPDEFHKTLSHNIINREFVSIWRGNKK